VPDLTWFLSTGEALGDAALARIDPKDPAQWRVDDLLEMLDAVPDHEKLHQALAAACRIWATTDRLTIHSLKTGALRGARF
jgi:hypothetical protein